MKPSTNSKPPTQPGRKPTPTSNRRKPLCARLVPTFRRRKQISWPRASDKKVAAANLAHTKTMLAYAEIKAAI